MKNRQRRGHRWEDSASLWKERMKEKGNSCSVSDGNGRGQVRQNRDAATVDAMPYAWRWTSPRERPGRVQARGGGGILRP